ncbi:MAG: serine protease [Rhodospirillaceae bacterium]|nr:serine protease [Rhodospirillaceae bacterium]
MRTVTCFPARWAGDPTQIIASTTILVVALLMALPIQGLNAKAPPESFADLAERLLPAVVNISTTQTIQAHQRRRGPDMPQFPPGSPFEEFFKDFFERNQPNGGKNGKRRPPRRAQSLGSGFIIDASGIVVTNNHVIAEADEITVRLQDDTEFEAKLLGRDPKTDLALLKIEPGDAKLTAVTFGDSAKLRVGDWVVAIGNPFGLGGTVTAGIVSARGRDINQGPYDDFIQTDASINKGNSGGPLFNLEGEVVGINTAIFSQTGGSVGIGFAVAARLAKPVVEQLRDFGRTRRGWLGVRIQTVTDEIAESFGLESAVGALVAEVTKGGPADTAGIRPGDVILSFNGKEVESMRRLPRIVAETPVGVDVPVKVWRDSRLTQVTARIGELEEAEKAQLVPASKAEESSGPSTGRVEAAGIDLSSLTGALRSEHSIVDAVEGVLITAVDPDSPAAEKGLRVGDVIVEIDQTEVSSPSEVINIVESVIKKGRKKSVLFTVNRQGSIRFVGLRVKKG